MLKESVAKENEVFLSVEEFKLYVRLIFNVPKDTYIEKKDTSLSYTNGVNQYSIEIKIKY